LVYVERKPGGLCPEFKEGRRIIENSLKQLLDLEGRESRKKLENRWAFQWDTPYFDISNRIVWGATAMILEGIYSVLEKWKEN